MMKAGKKVGRVVMAVAYMMLYFALFVIIMQSATIVVTVGSILFLLTLSTFAITSLVDPGIQPHQDLNLEMAQMSRPKTQRDVEEIRKRLSTFCNICQVSTPLRTRHCRFCNRCIDRFDHHCHWTGNCIGRKNYRFYVSFLIFGTITSLYILAALEISIFQNSEKTDQDPCILLEIAAILVGLHATYCIGSLLVFHLYIIAKGLTTNEYLRRKAGHQ